MLHRLLPVSGSLAPIRPGLNRDNSRRRRGGSRTVSAPGARAVGQADEQEQPHQRGRSQRSTRIDRTGGFLHLPVDVLDFDLGVEAVRRGPRCGWCRLSRMVSGKGRLMAGIKLSTSLTDQVTMTPEGERRVPIKQQIQSFFRTLGLETEKDRQQFTRLYLREYRNCRVRGAATSGPHIAFHAPCRLRAQPFARSPV